MRLILIFVLVSDFAGVVVSRELDRAEARVVTAFPITCCVDSCPTTALIASSYRLNMGMLRATYCGIPVLELFVPCCIYFALALLCALVYIERWRVHWRRRHDALMKNRAGQKLLRRKCQVCERRWSRPNTIGGGASFDHSINDLFFPCTTVLQRQL